MTFARLVLTATTNDALPELPLSELPPKQVAQSLVHFYMANVYSLYPFFSETILTTTLDDLYSQDDRFIKDTDMWFFHMALAVSSMAQSRVIHDDHYQNGVCYARRAIEFADRALAPGNVTQIQSLLFLTQFSMLDPAHFDSWHLIGFTARAVVDLGLHQDPPVSSSSDKHALDMRRRVFYCVYSLDRSVVPSSTSTPSHRLTNWDYRAISMVHARTFSFTDDSTDVVFPNSSVRTSAQQPMAPSQSSDPALLLFQLRRAQSFWYQELYQSHTVAPLHDPTSFVWQMCLEMREWGESLPQTLPPAIRQMFDQELRYSYVYCIAPSARSPDITDYNRILIFEHSVAYLDAMYEIAHNSINMAFYSYHDALKVYFMANQLLAVLLDAENMLLMGSSIAAPIPRPGGPPPPVIPQRILGPNMRMEDNLSRSLHCLERVTSTLGKFGERWEESAMFKLSFERISGETTERLRRRKEMQDTAAMEQQQQQHHQQQHHHQVQQGQFYSGPPLGLAGMQPQHSMPQQSREVRWVGVDPAQMMQGAPPPPPPPQ